MKIKFAGFILVMMTGWGFIRCTPGNNYPSAKSISENIEWSHSWIVNNNSLPKVLLIGDSHVEAYFPVVSDILKSDACCCKFTSSRSLGDPILIDQLKLLFKQSDFELICFNNGLHGSAYTDKQYGEFIPDVYQLLKKHCGRSVIWIYTTASREKGNLDQFTDFNNKVIHRNNLVREFSLLNNIQTVDFYDLSIKHKEFYIPDGVHFTQEGINAEAELITDKIKSILKN